MVRRAAGTPLTPPLGGNPKRNAAQVVTGQLKTRTLGEVAQVEHRAGGGAGGLPLVHVEQEPGRVQVPADRADDAGREELGAAGPAVAAAVDAVERDRPGARLRPGLPSYRQGGRKD